MKASEIDLPQFNNISDVEGFIDNNDYKLDLKDEIIMLWIKFRDYTTE